MNLTGWLKGGYCSSSVSKHTGYGTTIQDSLAIRLPSPLNLYLEVNDLHNYNHQHVHVYILYCTQNCCEIDLIFHFHYLNADIQYLQLNSTKSRVSKQELADVGNVPSKLCACTQVVRLGHR